MDHVLFMFNAYAESYRVLFYFITELVTGYKKRIVTVNTKLYKRADDNN